ncbi:transcriptional regulator [Bradyrhizobium sp. HKCCYLS2038]|uniref:transcriptional regulator n=1 Tax=Bradyrhizobium sp. HKCCYLS2038 TaxID=3420764 RepID=UPI003EBB3BB8
MTKLHKCQECGNPISARRAGQEFCAAPCRQTFNNRRMQRGAELYDLFRALRRERSTASEMNLWTQLCRLELQWQTEDDQQRPGRRSYMPPQKALTILKDKGSLPRGEVLCKATRPRAA